MSRVGAVPITVPKEVKVTLTDGLIEVSGAKGKLEYKFPEGIFVEQDDAILNVKRKDDTYKPLHGLSRTLINNMVVGVSEGFKKSLEIIGTGYRVVSSGNGLGLALGFSHPVFVPQEDGIDFVVQGNTITVEGIDKQRVGEIAAQIRKLKPPEPYKGKGIKYTDEVIKRKVGKTGGK
jgi:large subunit ribosomal protein L6